jgi:saccharopine dehydrogenase (NAD+, L-lysine-forming)
MKIGIIREGKNPPDKRTAFVPARLQTLQSKYSPTISFAVESSPLRCYTDAEYSALGIEITAEVDTCDILFGVKEVPITQLIPNKTYFFFSHTIKKQPRNRALLQAILKKNIRLIDYELLKDEKGNRVVAFGRWAGIVGAYNAFWTYGKKTALFEIKRAHECFDRKELEIELKKIHLPPIKIAVTGAGRVGTGVLEVLDTLKIKQVTPAEFLNQKFDEPVFVQLHSQDYNQRKSDGGYEKSEFYANPEVYKSDFIKYTQVSDILIAAAFWDPGAPRLFDIKDLVDPGFQVSVIADVTCDIEGSIPTTTRASTIANPVYDVDRNTGKEIPAFDSSSSISVMAIDNLPCELPREASIDFGLLLQNWVIPALLEENPEILERATIAQNGKITPQFNYLSDYVNQNE